MLRTILATLVTAGIFAASTAAQAASGPNTPFGNGIATQGTSWNGNTFNGGNWNGRAMNGGEWNGKYVNGNAVNGAEMRPGTVTIVDIKLPDGTTFQAK